MTERPDYYEALGIEPTATRGEIERAYNRLARLYQPDPDKDPVEPDKMRVANEAFDTLDDPIRRAAYHRERGLEEPPAEALRKERPRALTDRPTLAAIGLMLAGVAALVGGIVLGVLVVLDDDPGYVTLESGLKFRDLAEGGGPYPTAGQSVTVHYTGWLEDGTQFDSSVGGSPFTFVLGEGQVIEGWEQGVGTMRQGTRRELIIPPELAYGETGQGPIPPNATLRFEVQLLAIE